MAGFSVVHAAPWSEVDHTAAFGHLRVGASLPSFHLKTIDGEDFDSAKKLAGKVSVLIFWRTDQEFSKHALEALKKNLAELTPHSLDVIVISICSGSTPVEAIRKDAGEIGGDFTVLLDPDRTVYGQMGIRVYPAAGFFDREGRLQFVYGGYRRDFAQNTRNYLEFLLGRINAEELAKRMDPETGGMPAHPQYGLADYNLGMDLVRQAKYAEARKCLEKAWRSDPPHVPAGIELGFVLLLLKDASGAYDVFGKVLEKPPYSPRAIAGKGIALLNMGRSEEGLQLLEPLLAGEGSEPLAYYTAAETLEKQGKNEKALEYYRRGLKIACGLALSIGQD